MKSRPEPKKISYIKPNNTKNNNIKNNINNKNAPKTKKQNNIIDNLLIMNSPKKTYISSSNKINEKLFNKIKQYTFEAHLLNQAMNNSSKNNNKKNIKQNQDNNNSIFNKNKKHEELRYNSLDAKNSLAKLKRKNKYINKLYTDRNLNPFIKNQKVNKNIQIKTYSNEKVDNSEKKIQNLRNVKDNDLKGPDSLSRERKKNNVLNTNFKYTKPKLLNNFNIKRNVSANNRILENKKIYNYNKRENEEEFNINNMEENENLLFDIHTSYNLTTKNPFNFCSTNLQFRSSKNMLEKNSKNKKINLGIKEENENDDNNNSEFSFRKEKEKLNQSNDNHFFEINSNYINEFKKRSKNKILNNKKESALLSLHKKGINYDSINKDILSNSEFKGFGTPDNLEYSLEKKRKILNIRNKYKNSNKYYILKNNGIIYSKKFNNNADNEKSNNVNNISEKQKKLYRNENSLFSKNKFKNKNEADENKSPANEKYNNSNYHNHKLFFINSPQSNNISNLNRNKYENSYDDTYERNKKIKFNKILQNNEKFKEKDKSSSKYQSKSHSSSKPKSRAKSHLNKMENSKKDINRLNKLFFVIKTNWGNIIKIGINNIKLLDRNNKSIPIKYANYDIAKPYITKYIKGETKKLILGYDRNYNLKNIAILNGFNDTGVKYLMIENDRGKILWKGNIPKINMINIKKYYISIDNYNTNISANINKKSLLFSKTVFLNREENFLSNNIKNMTNTLQINQKEEIFDNSKKNYELCDKIKIKLLNNYGNCYYIGLSGIEFYDNNNKLINILESKKSLTINENIVNFREKKILYNLFNNKNNTTDPQYMFLTTNYNAFIKIEFKNCIKISKIIFYNYNNNLYKNCATKGILIYFYHNKKSNKIKKPIYLYKPPGEENIDYGQVLTYPFDKNVFYEKMIKENKIYLSLNNYKMIYNEEYLYYTPFLPFGFILKIEMISNYGNKNYIGFENIQLFNEENNEINAEYSSKKKNCYKINDYSMDSNNNENIDSNDKNIINQRIYSLPDLQKINLNKRPMVLSKYHFFNDSNNEFGENRIYFIFNECIVLSRICINNYNKYLDIAVKDVKILLDDNVIFEGVLKNTGLNNIFFNDKKNWNKNIDKKSKNISSNNTTALLEGLGKSQNGLHINKFLGKTFDFKKNEINNRNNEERYIEYEGKNGIKILKLNTEL